MRTRLLLAALAALCLLTLDSALSGAVASAEEAAPDATLFGKIVFFSGRDFDGDWPKGYDLYSINPDGSALTRITTNSAVGYLSYPAVSPDGTQIVVALSNKLLFFSANGTALGSIATPNGLMWVNDWSPTGEILITIYPSSDVQEELYSVNVATKQLRRLTNDKVRNLFASWSPDGSQIVYMSDYTLWIMKADGSQKRQIYSGDARDLDWSPDGTRIVFETQKLPVAPGYYHDLAIINVDGSGYRRITNLADKYVWEPMWSPDGRSVVFSYESGANSYRPGLGIIDVANGNIQYTTPEVGDKGPFWVAPAPKYTITGRIVDHTGALLPAVSIAYGGSKPILTDAAGAFTIPDLPAGSYTLTPTKPGYTFSPATRSVTVPPGATVSFTAEPKVTISHIELSQVTQTITDSVPLIANKTLLARVYLDCGPDCGGVPRVSGTLNISGPNGNVTREPDNGAIVARHPASWVEQRGDLAATLNFSIPANLVGGNMTFTVRSGAASLTVKRGALPGQHLKVYYLSMPYQGPGMSAPANPDRKLMEANISSVQAYFPLSLDDITYLRQPGLAQVMTAPYSCELLCPADAYLNALQAYWRRRAGNWGALGQPDRLLGFVPAAALDDICGLATNTSANGMGGAFATAIDTCGPDTVAHELGHTLSGTELMHTPSASGNSNCSERQATGVNNSYPPFPNLPRGSIGDWAVDLRFVSARLLNPAGTYDFMSYCSPKWVSAYNYGKLAKGFAPPDPASTFAEVDAPNAGSAIARQLLVTGMIMRDPPAAQLDPIFQISSPAAPDSNTGTEYCLEMRNAAAATLDKRCFDRNFINSETGETVGSAGFALALPYPTGTRAVVLTRLGAELARAAASASAPTVKLVAPNGGENWPEQGNVTLRWQGEDADGDALHYAVSYSRDGGATWEPVILDTTATTLTLDAANYAGATQGKIRVEVSDGFLTSSDDSDGVFAVASKPPVATILAPTEERVPGTPLLLQGYGYDLESGALAGSGLSWSSDRSGELGTGRQRLVTLPLGRHVITLTATDASGQKGVAQTTITIGYKLYLPVVRRQ